MKYSLFIFLYITLSGVNGRVSPRLKGCLEGWVNLGGFSSIYTDLTLETCNTLCFNKGYTYAALFNSTVCSCGHYENNKKMVQEADCNALCAGNREQRCGGRAASSLFHTGIKNVTSLGKEVGCFSDGGARRLLPDTKFDLIETNTPEICISICHSLNYKFAGLQDGIECYCGNNKESGVADSGCGTPCPGDKTKKCGGKFAMMLYKTGVLGGVQNTRIQYVGCYKNRLPGLLKQFQINYDNLIPTVCLAKCYSLRYEYGALFNGKQCQCGRTPVPIPELSIEAECSTACPGNQTATCGGETHVSGYYMGYVGNAVLGRGLGCFKDEDGNLLSGSSSNLGQRNSPQFCITKCIELGFPFAALSNIYECRCGKTPPSRLNSVEVRAAECNSVCPLSKTEFCGGQGLSYVYRTGLDDTFEEGMCKTSSTEINGKHSCTGDIVMEEKFHTLKLSQWKRTVQISSEDHEFVIYNTDEDNAFVKNGMLVIQPTLLNDTFIKSGTLNLRGCTAQLYSYECEQSAQSFSILPPVQSAQFCSTASFKYGILTIRAKLPSGDWISPRFELRPVRELYGRGHISGAIRIAMSRGNNILVSNNEDLGSRLLSTWAAVGSGGGDLKTQSASLYSGKPWNKEFHNYTLVWSPNGLWTYVDDNVSEKKKIYDIATDGKLATLMGFTEEESKPWNTGTYIAPFDNPMEICVGVGVGGSRDFPDGSFSNGKLKPWNNYEVKGTLNFWKAGKDWQKTWSEESRLIIDNIKIEAV